MCIFYKPSISHACFHKIFLTVENSLRAKCSFFKPVNMFFYPQPVLEFCRYMLQCLEMQILLMKVQQLPDAYAEVVVLLLINHLIR